MKATRAAPCFGPKDTIFSFVLLIKRPPLIDTFVDIRARANADDHPFKAASAFILFHPDYTVGFGIAPKSADPADLSKTNGRSRARAIARHDRRWGIAPRPENFANNT